MEPPLIQASLFARDRKRSLNHHDENYIALVPSANPAHTPPVDAITQVGTPEQVHELGFHFHSHDVDQQLQKASPSCTKEASASREIGSARFNGTGWRLIRDCLRRNTI